MKSEVPDGATPIDDAEGLIPPVTTMGDLNAVEAENILAAFRKHLSRRKSADARWLDEEFVRRLHKDMFGMVWEWAGLYRDKELTIGIPVHRIREEVAKLLGDLRYWQTTSAADMPILERAARLHHRLVKIHPFRNGNGRHARLLTDVYLKSQGQPSPVWPSGDLAAAGAVRTEYIGCLRAADRDDYEPLIGFMRRLLPS